MDTPYRIRPAGTPDLPQVAAIERQVFSDPWSAGAFVDVLWQGTSWVAEAQGHVAGYLIGRAAADEAEVLNLAVAPFHRRRGIGTALLEYALLRFREAGARRAFLEVRESNRSAQDFYRTHGFHLVGRRRFYYSRPAEDALILAREMAPFPPA